MYMRFCIKHLRLKTLEMDVSVGERWLDALAMGPGKLGIVMLVRRFVVSGEFILRVRTHEMDDKIAGLRGGPWRCEKLLRERMMPDSLRSEEGKKEKDWYADSWK